MLSALILYSCPTTGEDCWMTVVADNIPYFTCSMAGLSESARYVAEHPKRKVVKYRCVDPRRLSFYLHRSEA